MRDCLSFLDYSCDGNNFDDDTDIDFTGGKSGPGDQGTSQVRATIRTV
jgi:hypothetical protein